MLEDVFLRRENEGARTKQRLVTRLENLKAQLTRVESAFLYDRSIDHETYTTQRDRLRGDITDVTAELELLFDGADDFQMLLNFAGWVLNDVATNWIDADVRGRRALQAVVFPSGLLFDGQKFGNIDPCFAFKHLAGDSDERSKMASLMPASWNQITTWLRTIGELRSAA